MARKTDKYVQSCLYCGGSEIIEAYQPSSYAPVYGADYIWGGQKLHHSVCRNCGSILRSYVENPEKLLKKKDRKEN